MRLTAVLVLGLLPVACVPRVASPPPFDPERVAAVEACRAAGLVASEPDANDDPGERGAAVATACAPVYRQPACRAAFERWASIPVERRSWTVATACRDAYCPGFAAPRPELCDLPDPDLETVWRLWPLLQARIVADEIGLVGPDRERFLASVPPGEPPPPVTIRLPPREPVVIETLAITLAGDDATVEIGGVAHAVAAGPATLAERLRPLLAGHEGETVLIAATPATDFARVRDLVDALKQLGFSRMAFQSLPGSP